MIFAAEFPWDVSIAAVSTLIAGLGAAWATTRASRSQGDRRWRLDKQAEATVTLLREGSEVYLALRRSLVVRQEKPGAVEGEAVDWSGWNSALGGLSLVAELVLVDAALAWDEQVWMLSGERHRQGSMPADEWRRLSAGFVGAQLAFANTAREVLGAAGRLSALSGRPTGSPA